MNKVEKANTLRGLHVKGRPLVLFNIWDAGSARAVAEAGAAALATGSWSVAAAQGFADGEQMPLDVLCDVATRIVAAVDLPVSIDFEGGYAEDPAQLTTNGALLAATGGVGCNFEDQIVGGDRLYPRDVQALRIAGLRTGVGHDVVINARTDIFLKQPDAPQHSALMEEAIARAGVYADAGADCFFAPGLTDLGLIAALCDAVPIPVNVMHAGPVEQLRRLADAGVSRISHGPFPYRAAMSQLTQAAADRLL